MLLCPIPQRHTNCRCPATCALPRSPERAPEDRRGVWGALPVVSAPAPSRCSRNVSAAECAARVGPGAPPPRLAAPRPGRGLSPGLGGRPPAPRPARTSSRRPAPSTFLPRRACPAPGSRRSRTDAAARRPLAGPAMKAAQAPGEEAPPGVRSVKVVLVGDGGCGKTSLLMVFADGAFPEVSGRALRLCVHARGVTVTHRRPACPFRAGAAELSARAGLPRGLPAERGVLLLPSGVRAPKILPRRMAPTWERCHRDWPWRPG